jgi:hypothetical protein
MGRSFVFDVQNDFMTINHLAPPGRPDQPIQTTA